MEKLEKNKFFFSFSKRWFTIKKDRMTDELNGPLNSIRKTSENIKSAIKTLAYNVHI